MAKPISGRLALGNITDLTTPTAAQQYPLGLVVTVEDSDTKAAKKFIYVKAHGALTKYIPYVLNFTGTSAAEVKTAAPVTTAAPGQLVCVPQVAFAATTLFGFVQIQGNCVAICTNETCEVSDFLQVLNTGVALVVDGTTGSTVLSAYSCAIMMDADYSAAGNDIYLLGRWAETAAA